VINCTVKTTYNFFLIESERNPTQISNRKTDWLMGRTLGMEEASGTRASDTGTEAVILSRCVLIISCIN